MKRIARLPSTSQLLDAYIVPHIGRVKLAKLMTLTVEGFHDQLLKEVGRRSAADDGKRRARIKLT